jgi:hypothetical protein
VQAHDPTPGGYGGCMASRSTFRVRFETGSLCLLVWGPRSEARGIIAGAGCMQAYSSSDLVLPFRSFHQVF